MAPSAQTVPVYTGTGSDDSIAILRRGRCEISVRWGETRGGEGVEWWEGREGACGEAGQSEEGRVEGLERFFGRGEATGKLGKTS